LTKPHALAAGDDGRAQARFGPLSSTIVAAPAGVSIVRVSFERSDSGEGGRPTWPSHRLTFVSRSAPARASGETVTITVGSFSETLNAATLNCGPPVRVQPSGSSKWVRPNVRPCRNPGSGAKRLSGAGTSFGAL
jgi:hypothetical protein